MRKRPGKFLLLISENTTMKTFARLLKAILLSSIAGVILGIAASYIYFFLIALPEAEHLQGMARSEFLHLAGHSLEIFGFLGGLLGFVFGIGKSVKILLGERWEGISDFGILW